MFSTYQPLAVYPGDGVTTEFNAPDLFYDTVDVRAVLVIDGEEIPQYPGTHYNVVVIGREPIPPNRQLGKLQWIVPPPAGADVVPFILPPTVQDQAFQGRAVTPQQHERVHDRAVMTLALLSEFFSRSYRSPLNTPPALRTIVAGRNGYVPTWDAAGNLIEGPTVDQVNTVAGFIGQVVQVAAIKDEIIALEGLSPEIVGLYAIRASINALGPVAAGIPLLAVIDEEIAALAPVAANIAQIGPAIAQVVAVAGIQDQVEALALLTAEIVALYAIRTQIAALAPHAAAIETLAPLDDELIALAPVAAQIAQLGPVATQVGLLGAIAPAISAVAAIDDDVVTVANNIAAILAVPGYAQAAEESAAAAAASADSVSWWKGSQAAYDAIPVKDPETLYFIV